MFQNGSFLSLLEFLKVLSLKLISNLLCQLLLNRLDFGLYSLFESLL